MRPSGPSPPRRVLLTLSATLVEPVRRPGRSPSDEPLTHLRFASGFTFRNPRYPWQHSDFPADSAGGAVWSRLALAARSTSSFPVAFEAALVDAARPPSFIDSHVAQGQGLTIDMGGVFQDRGTSDGRTEQFIVSDGGILDNIPLGRALEGIVEAPAHGPTDRFLIYVQPGAPAPTAADTDPASLVRRRASFAVLQGLLSARMPSEDIIGDLQQFDANNVLIERAASLRRSGFGQLLSQEELLGAARVAWSGYRRLRADEDQRLVSRLLDDPLTALGEDPFPTHVGGDPVAEDRWRSPLDARRGDGGLAPLSRGLLAVALAERFHGRLPDQFPEAAGLVGVGARTLLRITQLLIEWSQHVEGSAPGAGALKGRLYRTAAFAREAIDRPRQLGWVTLAATMPDDADEDAFADGARALEHLVQLRPDEARAICDALLARDGDEVLRSGVASRMALLDTLPGRAWHTVSEPTGVVDLRSEILARVLVPTARELRALAAPTIDPATPAGYLDRALDGEITAATLAALEVVAYPEFASGLPARRPVRFQRLSAGNPTPLAPRFTSLLADARAQGKWWDPEVTDPAAQEGIHLSLKLAGNELANFSAFLRDDWRRNDWLWGRLDAVPTLVDLLLAG